MADRRRLLICGLTLLGLLVGGCARQQGNVAASKIIDVTIHRRAFHLELALDAPARFQGLSDRKQIASDGGMLFVFPHPDELTFVMRRCYVPIDLIFLDPSGRVVAMHRMAVEPPDTPEDDLKRYHSEWPAQFAIELAGGSLDQLNLKPGEKIDLPAADLKHRAK